VTSVTKQDPIRHKPTGIGLVLLGIIFAYTAWCHLPDLGHAYLPGWDEAVHAAVAGNLVKHPLTPTLFDQPFIPFERNDWQANNVWLHMPPLPFWQSALSVGLLGRSFFALRLPSFILFLLSLGCVYLLGLRLYGEKIGLLAALLMSACPFAWLQVQGYHFGDMTDVSLAFWLLACVLALERAVTSGSKRWACAAGIFQGLAILSKSALALAPAGAILMLWIIGAIGRDKDKHLDWSIPAIHWGIAALMAFAWRLYSSVRWPAEFAHEQGALWSHVISSYEGHGKPWDALFNDLIANLFTPAMIVWVLAGAALITWMAFRHRSKAMGLHALWMLGTWIPLLVVKTKVPAVLFGMFPALALATACLIVRATRRMPRIWTSAVLVTPGVFLLISDHLPGDFWRFMSPLTPAMSVWPHLPLQLAIILACGFLFWLAAKIIGRLASGNGSAIRYGQTFWMLLMRAAVIVPFAWLLGHAAATRQGFDIIADYNPAERAAEDVRKQLPERAALIIEGVTNGRQRPDLTFAFLTGKPAQLVRSSRIGRACAAAEKLGTAFLVTPVKRKADPIDSPRPGSGYWTYELQGSAPEQDLVAPEAAGVDAASLVELVPERTTVEAGSSLALLASWRIQGERLSCNTRNFLAPLAGGDPLETFPLPADFPSGFEGTILHTLAPPGLLWGSRPLGDGLIEQYSLHPGELVADGFTTWIPLQIKPGSYRLGLLIKCAGRSEAATPENLWPVIQVTP